MELLVEQSQLLFLTKDILAIEGHLLSLVIGFLLLFLYLLSRLVEHVKELVFALLRRLEVGDWFLWR